MALSSVRQHGGGRPRTDGTGGASVRGAVGLSEVHRLPVAALLPSDSPRHQTESPEYARLLADTGAELPPIIVHRATMRIVDGTHRVHAARLRGQAEIDARFFEGAAEDAFVLAVESNVRHGLPLSLPERTAAAVRILRSHPQWSDRAIASATGLSAKTVAAQRQKTGRGPAGMSARIGRDGRARPLSSAEGRRLAGRLIVEFPEASLRVIARMAGISPGTVRDVRARLSRGEDIVPPRQRAGELVAVARSAVSPASSGGRRTAAARASVPESSLEPEADPAAGTGASGAAVAPAASVRAAGGDGFDASAAFRSLCRDPSIRLTEAGRTLLRMMDPHVTDRGRWERAARSVPAHRARAVAALARECARQWERFAAHVESTAPAPATATNTGHSWERCATGARRAPCRPPWTEPVPSSSSCACLTVGGAGPAAARGRGAAS
ncbi:ParB/RepB/Spo0J family partition protein [Streptomyces sp. NPDC003077]|uniref:ParB/RepB/Spo0J family partition protein n=1 Tax=Streptomyces sp. NPDC003077 TaxID=3154443 RepID=UPI0033A6CFB4